MRFRVSSSDSINSYGSRVLVSGIRTDNFIKNPIMLYNHNRWDTLPIGKWKDLEKSSKELTAEPVFDFKDDYAAKIASKVQDGFLNAASIGIRVIKTSSDTKDLLPGQAYETITECELVEISIVDIPADKSAVRLYELSQTGELVQLSEQNTASILKPINPPTDMKKVALALGLAENATEEQIIASVEVLKATNLTFSEALKPIGIEKAEDAGAKLATLGQALKASNEQLVTLTAENAKLKEEKETGRVYITDVLKKAELAAAAKQEADKNKKDLGEDDPKKLGLKFDELSRNNPKALGEIKLNDPELFKKMAAAYRAL